MRLKLPTLLVCTNPFLFADAEGRPCCAVGIDPYDPGYPKDSRGYRGPYVGARIVSADLVRKGDESFTADGNNAGGLRADRHDRVWGFKREPFKIYETDYYKRQIREWALIAADEATATKCGVKFTPVDVVRAETKAATGATDAVWLEPDGE